MVVPQLARLVADINTHQPNFGRTAGLLSQSSTAFMHILLKTHTLGLLRLVIMNDAEYSQEVMVKDFDAVITNQFFRLRHQCHTSRNESQLLAALGMTSCS
jgi:hypothetical protein